MKKKNTNNNRMVKLFTLVTLIIVIICAAGFAASAKSDRSEPVNTYYQSIRINSGDSLWSIAEEYCPSYIDMHDYIDGIKDINNIKNSNITAGEYILVTVYK